MDQTILQKNRTHQTRKHKHVVEDIYAGGGAVVTEVESAHPSRLTLLAARVLRVYYGILCTLSAPACYITFISLSKRLSTIRWQGWEFHYIASKR